MKKGKYIILIILIFFLLFFFIANIKTTTLIGINHKVTEFQIPIYLKIINFYHRHYNYKYLVKEINKNIDNEKDIILNATVWIKKNIKKIPKGVDIVDNHPLTIFKRRLGSDDQFSDLLSVLLVYSNIDSFFISKLEKNSHSFTFFKIDDYWSIIDPYYGIFFTNNKHFFAPISDLKNGVWQISNLEFEKINRTNFKNTFGKKFNDYEEIKNYFDSIFFYIPSSNNIDNTYIFDLSGRSYIQNPIGRLKYEIYSKIKGL